MQSIAIIGAGSFGTALAHMLAQANHQVKIWAREPELIPAINQKHENVLFHPGFALHKGIVASAKLAEVLDGSDIAILAVPSKYLPATSATLAPHLGKHTTLLNVAKGIHGESE